jgi:hypothetical protein
MLVFLLLEQKVLDATHGHIWQHDSFSFSVIDRSDNPGHNEGAE